MSQNIQKGVLHNILLQKLAEILHLFVFMVVLAAILNFTSRGHQRLQPFCLRWILETQCPDLTSRQISKTCHQVHDCSKYWGIPHSPPLCEIYEKIWKLAHLQEIPRERLSQKCNLRYLRIFFHFLYFIQG